MLWGLLKTCFAYFDFTQSRNPIKTPVKTGVNVIKKIICLTLAKIFIGEKQIVYFGIVNSPTQ
jgi:hypothetical protein